MEISLKKKYIFLSNSMIKIFFFVIILQNLFQEAKANKSLFLKRYSPIIYDLEDLNLQHNRVRRSIDDHIKLSFESHGKKFSMELYPSEISHFENDFIEVNDQKVPISDLKMYEGKLVDEYESHVKGAIIDGIFIGEVNSKKDGIFYVESAKRYDTRENAHAIIYHEDDVKSSDEIKRAKRDITEFKIEEEEQDGVGCGSHKKSVRELLEEKQKHITEELRKKNEGEHSFFSFFKRSTRVDEPEDASFKYTQQANLGRKKRQSGGTQNQFPGGQSVCSLYLKVDPFLYDWIYNREGGKNVASTTQYLIYYLNQQVASLNTIVNPVSFYTDSSNTNFYQGLSFKVFRTKIYQSAKCSSYSTNEQLICQNYLDPTTLLNYISQDDFSSYCQGFVFTARDFGDGTLGLAWLASPNAAGGICTPRVLNNNQNLSLNTGFVSLINYKQRQPDRLSQITFAHEMGHALGSTHDNTTSGCVPGDGNSGGNYIMYSRAVSGDKSNNALFSSCSKYLMGVNLNYVLQNKNCLKLTNAAICGNGIVETGEQCDCGFNDTCTETCCVAAQNPPVANECQLASSSYQCSPSQGSCCSSTTCTYAPLGTICQSSSGCIDDIKCSGSSATCPNTNPSSYKPDNSTCNFGTQVCTNGVCGGTICSLYGMTQCFLQTSDSTVNCHLACNGTMTNNQCVDTASIPNFGSPNGGGYTLRPGSACTGTGGYCDYYSKCRAYDANTAFSKLAQTLLRVPKLTSDDVKNWAIKYWWLILIFVIIFLGINAVILICLMAHVKSDNPEKKKKLNWRHTLRNPGNPFRKDPVIPRNRVLQVKKFRAEGSNMGTKPTAREIVPSTLLSTEKHLELYPTDIRRSSRSQEGTRRNSQVNREEY